ncbi:MAG: type II toxin-antitoxin system RelE/ParE family toxin [Bacillota bacterium]
MNRKCEIYYLPSATNDLEEIIDYIKLDSPKSAVNMLNLIDETISKLGDFPEIGVVPKNRRLKKLGYRILIIGNYLAFYVIKDDMIEIRRVLHGNRNYKFLL